MGIENGNREWEWGWRREIDKGNRQGEIDKGIRGGN